MCLYANLYFMDVNGEGLYILGWPKMGDGQTDGRKDGFMTFRALESFRSILEAYYFEATSRIYLCQTSNIWYCNKQFVFLFHWFEVQFVVLCEPVVLSGGD